MTKYTEQDRVYHRELIWNNLIELFQKKKFFSDKSLIKAQRKFINKFNIISKNKYKTITILENYCKNPDKALAEQIFWRTVRTKNTLLF